MQKEICRVSDGHLDRTGVQDTFGRVGGEARSQMDQVAVGIALRVGTATSNGELGAVTRCRVSCRGRTGWRAHTANGSFVLKQLSAR